MIPWHPLEHSVFALHDKPGRLSVGACAHMLALVRRSLRAEYECARVSADAESALDHADDCLADLESCLRDYCDIMDAEEAREPERGPTPYMLGVEG